LLPVILSAVNIVLAHLKLVYLLIRGRQGRYRCCSCLILCRERSNRLNQYRSRLLAWINVLPEPMLLRSIFPDEQPVRPVVRLIQDDRHPCNRWIRLVQHRNNSKLSADNCAGDDRITINKMSAIQLQAGLITIEECDRGINKRTALSIEYYAERTLYTKCLPSTVISCNHTTLVRLRTFWSR
jgi:hypothetical protein